MVEGMDGVFEEGGLEGRGGGGIGMLVFEEGGLEGRGLEGMAGAVNFEGDKELAFDPNLEGGAVNLEGDKEVGSGIGMRCVMAGVCAGSPGGTDRDCFGYGVEGTVEDWGWRLFRLGNGRGTLCFFLYGFLLFFLSTVWIGCVHFFEYGRCTVWKLCVRGGV